MTNHVVIGGQVFKGVVSIGISGGEFQQIGAGAVVQLDANGFNAGRFACLLGAVAVVVHVDRARDGGSTFTEVVLRSQVILDDIDSGYDIVRAVVTVG